MEKRENYIDIIRGIGIILVVLGHIVLKFKTNNLVVWIYSFHLPLFFITSGILLNKKNRNYYSKQYILNKVKKMLIPYFGYSLITIIIMFIVNGNVSQITKIIFNTVILNGYGPLWFLPSLLISELLFILIMKNNRRSVKISMFTFLIFLVTIFSKIIQFQIWNSNFVLEIINKLLNIINRSIIGVLFISAGYYYDRYRSNEMNKIIILYISLIVFTFNIFASQINGLIDLHYSIINNALIYFYISVSSSLALIEVIRRLKWNEKIFSYFGKNSLIVMSTHYNYMLIELSNVVISIFSIKSNNIKILLCMIIVCIIETIIIFIHKKIFKRRMKK